MLLVLTALLIVLGIGICIFGVWSEGTYTPDWRASDKELNSKLRPIKHFFYSISDGIKGIGVVIGCIGVVALVIMLIILPFNYMGVDGYVELNKERYKALTYKIESGACRDEFGLLSKEVIDEVQDWNECVVKGKKIQNDFWLGVFYPDVYDQYETIDYERYVE